MGSYMEVGMGGGTNGVCYVRGGLTWGGFSGCHLEGEGSPMGSYMEEGVSHGVLYGGGSPMGGILWVSYGRGGSPMGSHMEVGGSPMGSPMGGILHGGVVGDVI